MHGRVDRAADLAGRLLAMHAGHRLPVGLRVVRRAAVIVVDAQPVHLAAHQRPAPCRPPARCSRPCRRRRRRCSRCRRRGRSPSPGVASRPATPGTARAARAVCVLDRLARRQRRRRGRADQVLVAGQRVVQLGAWRASPRSDRSPAGSRPETVQGSARGLQRDRRRSRCPRRPGRAGRGRSRDGA